jgi:hypothetical protein
MSVPPEHIERREAIRRVALLLGGAVSAPAALGVLAGCGADAGGARGADGGAWAPRALTAAQAELVATLAEVVLPETDTPGARAAGVHRFVDVMLAEYYAPDERARFVAGLAAVDARARRARGRPFVRCAPAEQLALVEALDREAFAPPPPGARPAAPPPFFRTFKELTLLGYYTSEAGATRELRHAPVPGRFEGCVPRTPGQRAWAV